MGHMGNVECLLSLHGSRVMGHMSNGGMGDGAHCHNNV